MTFSEKQNKVVILYLKEAYGVIRLDDMRVQGSTALMHLGLKNGPFVPQLSLMGALPDGPQAYVLNVLWLQKKKKGS
jgi:hypothetical protein